MPPTIILPVVPSAVQPLWISHGDALPPTNGLSVVRQDGFMETLPPPPLLGLYGETIHFETPDIFHHTHWRTHLPEPLQPTEPPPPAPTERPKSVSLPPSPLAAERAMKIMGRTITKELRGQGYDDNGIIQIATGLISLIIELLAEKKKSFLRVDADSEDSEASEASVVRLNDALKIRMRAVFGELIAAGYRYMDLVWIPNELIAQVSGGTQKK